MSVLDTDVVDMVATRKDSQDVKLVIADHLPWDDFEAHALLLQAKLNAYIAFVESGQWLQSKPNMPANPRPVISIALLHAPSPAAGEFLLKVAEIIEGAGIGFEYTSKQGGSEA